MLVFFILFSNNYSYKYGFTYDVIDLAVYMHAYLFKFKYPLCKGFGNFEIRDSISV